MHTPLISSSHMFLTPEKETEPARQQGFQMLDKAFKGISGLYLFGLAKTTGVTSEKCLHKVFYANN